MIHARMLREPWAFLSATAAFRAVHAVGAPEPPAVGSAGLQVTRRLAGATPEDSAQRLVAFFGGVQEARWNDRTIEANATAVLLGGTVMLDTATTEAIEVYAVAADLVGETLDRVPPTNRLPTMPSPPATEADVDTERRQLGFTLKDGYPEFEKQATVLLRLDGLPTPGDARPGLREHSLEVLQAAAYGEAKPLGRALRATMPGTVSSHGARNLELYIRPILRNQAFVRGAAVAPKKDQMPPEGVIDAGTIWLPSTRRPPVPEVDRTQNTVVETLDRPRGQLGVQRVVKHRPCAVRIWLARPWFTSGEEEMLGVVLWPPNLAARGTELHEAPKPPPDMALLDEDIGPAGEYVSRWGEDPIDDRAALPAAGLFESRHVQAAPGTAPGLYVPRAWMPVPAQDGPQSPDTDAPAPAPGTRSMAVALMAFHPRFDQSENLWYVDLALDTGTVPRPRIRLGLVRYQQHAREDDIPLEGEEPVRLRVSQPVREFVQPLAARRAEASWSTAGNRTTVVVKVSGPSTAAPRTPPLPAPPAKTPTAKTPTATTMKVELVRFRAAKGHLPALEEPVTGADGKPLACMEWAELPSKGKGLIGAEGSLSAWTCEFTWERLPIKEGWSHAVLVTETRTLLAATQRNEETCTQGPQQMGESGPTYLVRLDLEAG